MNKKTIICTIIGLIILALIIAIIISNKQNKETSQNYTENIIDNENISSNQSIEDISPITENINVTTETNSAKTGDAIENSIQEQATDTEALEQEKVKDLEASINSQSKEEIIDMIKIKVNNSILEVKLENNEATKNLVERLKKGDITVNAKEYGGFEKVGNLGFSLPRNDTNINTSAGDIVLYQGNQISLFYNSSSWSYTKLGKVQNISSKELKNILGSGDVTLVLSLN